MPTPALPPLQEMYPGSFPRTFLCEYLINCPTLDHIFHDLALSSEKEVVQLEPDTEIQVSKDSPATDDNLLKSFPCEHCGRIFPRPSSLEIHKNTHTGAKRGCSVPSNNELINQRVAFVCPNTACGRAFNVKSNMTRHHRSCHKAQADKPPDHSSQGEHSAESAIDAS